jgi:hypothetical protein
MMKAQIVCLAALLLAVGCSAATTRKLQEVLVVPPSNLNGNGNGNGWVERKGKRARLSAKKLDHQLALRWRWRPTCVPLLCPSPCRNVGSFNGNINGNDNLGSANGNRE